MSIHRFILIGNGIKESDKELFFGPLKEDDPEFEILPESTEWADLLVPHIFKRKTQCRKNGWNEIPKGFTDKGVGKKKDLHITILKIIGEKDK